MVTVQLKDGESMSTRVTLRKRVVRESFEEPPYQLADGLAIDNSYRDLTKAGRSPSGPVVLDLGGLDYLDHEALLYLGALLRFRVRHNQETLLELPRDSRVWEFMRAWNFPQFIANVAERPFKEVLAEASRRIVERDETRFPKYAKVIELPGGGQSELLPTEHFQITPIELSDNPFRSATIAQSAWLERHTLSILNAYLDGQGGRVGGLVVLEAVLNAAMHPEATMAYTSSQIVLPSQQDPSGRPILQIAVWDDGLPLAVTLKRRLDEGLAVTSPAFGAFLETFQVRLIRSSGREEVRMLTSRASELPADFPWLTVAAFMAGVTSLPDRLPADTGDGIRGGEIGHNFPGMGLRYIRRNVLNLWKGRIRYWTNSYRFTMRALDEPDGYAVTVQYRPKAAWPLQGNLLYLDIPLDGRAVGDALDV
jgi:hypothetical protein